MHSTEVSELDLSVVHRAVVEAIETGDAHLFASLYEHDGRLLPPDGTVVRGRDAIAVAFQSWLDLGFCGQRVEVDEFTTSGDLAVEAGTAYGEFRTPDGGGTNVAVSNYVIMHRRQQDGSWLMTRDIWTAVPEGIRDARR